MTKRMPEETAAERGESPSEAAGLRGPRGDTAGGSEACEGRRRRWLPEPPRKPKGSEAAKQDQRQSKAEPEGLAKLRRETRRGLGIGLLKPQVTGAGGEDRSRPSVAKAAKGFVARAARQGAPAPRRRRGPGGAKKNGAPFGGRGFKKHSSLFKSMCPNLLRRRQRSSAPPPAPRRLVKPRSARRARRATKSKNLINR